VAKYTELVTEVCRLRDGDFLTQVNNVGNSERRAERGLLEDPKVITKFHGASDRQCGVEIGPSRRGERDHIGESHASLDHQILAKILIRHSVFVRSRYCPLGYTVLHETDFGLFQGWVDINGAQECDITVV
jgi:hypothetical protein